MNLTIKNMVCLRCQMVVRYELEKLGIKLMEVAPGRVEILEAISPQQLADFKLALINAELEVIESTKSILTDKIIGVINDMINCSKDALKINFSYYLSKKLNLDYTYMANVFSENQGITIEHFIIQARIERVKQLICFEELNLTQISWQLHFSSVAHLSTQFKKITGITPSQYKYRLQKHFAPANV